MKFRIELAGTALLAGVLALFGVVSLPVLGQDSSSSSPPSAEAVAPPAAASEADILAEGKRIWNDAACYNCHGNNGQGGHSSDFPAGPSLRKSVLDPATMLAITECGLPDTRMPAWLQGAYTETPCYGDEVGPVLPGVLLAGAYTEDQLKDLIAYIQVNFMKQPMPTWSDQE
jgi:mono/diheme cytochrome c family protein